MSFMEEFNHLKIQLRDIKLATDNFGPNNIIGHGGFGLVYKGELSILEGIITVACKRLNRNFGQGNVEFWKEIMMLSKCKHQNLVSLLGFCFEGDERILVYEYASRGSLDRHLNDISLTWMQRLKICIGVARALNYLHDPMKTQQRVLHRDIKSSNVLLDEKWDAKVSDFGLSKIGPANQPHTYVFSNAVGTLGYCDPLYWEMGFLSKESDVYSFGVVMFEVICGKLCCEYLKDGQVNILVHLWKRCYDENRLNDMIYRGLKEQMDLASLKTFSSIAYRCLKKSSEERPTMAEIVHQLEYALEQQEVLEDLEKRVNSEEMQRIADLALHPLSYVSQSQLLMLLMKGILVDDGKKWLSVNKKGEHYELISAAGYMFETDQRYIYLGKSLRSRFRHLLRYETTVNLKVRVMTQFLSPHVTYIINLVYKSPTRDLRKPFKYKLKHMTQYLTSFVAHLGEDGFLRTELFQFTCNKQRNYFNIHFLAEKNFARSYYLEGIEFCPVDFLCQKRENESLTDETKVQATQPITYSDIDREKKLPSDYTKIVKWSKDAKEGMTRKELYFLLRKGLHINDGQQWFFISKTSKKCHMLPARAILQEEKTGWNFLSWRNKWIWKSQRGSRFEEVAESCDTNHLAITFLLQPHLLSPITTYACYLVYKLPENASVFEDIVITCFAKKYSMYKHIEKPIYLVTPPHTPIIGPNTDESRSSRTRKIKGHPKLRKDGWMEIHVWEFQNNSAAPDSLLMDGYLKSLNEWNFTGLLVQGIEFRPLKVSYYIGNK